MRKLIKVLGIPIAGLVLATAAFGDDADDVKEAVLELNAAHNAGDVEIVSKYLSELSIFNLAGNLLLEVEFNKNELRARIEDGLKTNRSWRHLEVEVYGNTALVTGYHLGRTTSPDGSFIQGTRRVSEFWVKKGGNWKSVHRHASQLEPDEREQVSP